jgi:uncharacterized protein (TIGR00251 family)
MDDLSDLYDVSGDDVVLRVHAQPGAGRTAITGRHGTSLKVRVAAPPVDGRANETLRAALAEAFALPVADVTLASGGSSRVKRFRLHGITAAHFAPQLARVVAGGNAGGGRGVGRTVR